jgi:lactoylglutathione lyase
MLRKIDCVMIRVEDPEAAAVYYSDVFGLRRLWQDETSVGLGFPETDAEVVLHCNSEILSPVEVYYLVDDVVYSVRVLRENGCTVITEPFDIPIGKCGWCGTRSGRPVYAGYEQRTPAATCGLKAR